MWKYNNTTEYNTNNDEIYHYGIPGMQWGHRKDVRNAYSEMKKAKSDYNRYYLKNLFSKENYLAGTKNIEKAKKNKKNLEKLKDIRNKSIMNVIDKRAKEKYDIAYAKTKDKNKALKAEQKEYFKALKKNTYGSGGVGSISDSEYHHGNKYGNEHFLKDLAKKKGKKYADIVENKLNRTHVKKALVAIGGAIAMNYFITKHM